MGMSMVSTAQLSDSAVTTYIQTVKKTIKLQNLNYRSHMDCNRGQSTEQEENNHKQSSTGNVKYSMEKTTTIN